MSVKYLVLMLRFDNRGEGGATGQSRNSIAAQVHALIEPRYARRVRLGSGFWSAFVSVLYDTPQKESLSWMPGSRFRLVTKQF